MALIHFDIPEDRVDGLIPAGFTEWMENNIGPRVKNCEETGDGIDIENRTKIAITPCWDWYYPYGTNTVRILINGDNNDEIIAMMRLKWL